MASTQKDTIYIDIDDEITSIIEKVNSSPQKIVALVLPKRAAVLQSIVNMKLLKRSADDVKKRVVLITSEAGLLPLAGAVGLYVAKTLQSKPVIPPPPIMPDDDLGSGADDAGGLEETPVDPTKPVGELAGLPIADEETIEVDNEVSPAAGAKADTKAKKDNKKLKVPNFNKFRLRLILAGLGLVLLLIGWYFANFVMPTAKVVIKTDTQNINSNVKFTASPNAQEFDLENAIVPAMKKELKKTESQKAPATGQKNKGEKAKGEVSLKNCSNSVQPVTIPAGTAVSSNNLTFITDESVNLPASSFNGLQQCTTSEKDVDVTAQHAGDNYNLSARDYVVAGHAGVKAKGSDMSGGTNQIVKVVSQGDIDGLKQKVVDTFTSTARDELKQQFQAEGLIPLEDTFGVGQPLVVSTPNANDEAEEVTANITMTFTMQGIKKEHVVELVKKDVEDDIDSEKQVILEDGLDEPIFQINARQDNGDVSYSLQTLVVAGPQIDENILKKEIAGKKRSEAENIIRRRPGVKDVTVDFSPFWVGKTPKKPGKVMVTIESVEQPDDASENE